MLTINFNPSILGLFFNIKVREACKSCKRYGKKSTCPPYIDSVAYYQSLLPSYKYGVLFIEKFELKYYTQSTWQELGEYSSKVIQKALSKHKNELFNNHHFPIIFGAGSCKNCKKCSNPCKFPSKSITPIEAVGLDVVGVVSKLAKINLVFPIKEQFYRVGVILWD